MEQHWASACHDRETSFSVPFDVHDAPCFASFVFPWDRTPKQLSAREDFQAMLRRHDSRPIPRPRKITDHLPRTGPVLDRFRPFWWQLSFKTAIKDIFRTHVTCSYIILYIIVHDS